MPQHLPPTEPAPAALQSARYTYDGDGAMVRGEVNGVVTFYAGRHYHQEVDGSETTVRKFYALGSMTIAVRTVARVGR